MSLSGYKMRTSIAVSDITRAAEFHEGTLGLSPAEIQANGSRIYACGGDASLHVYPSPVHAGKATATLATWYVGDVEEVVDELRSRGVTFERYDDPSLVRRRQSRRHGGSTARRWRGPPWSLDQAACREHRPKGLWRWL